MEDGAGRDARAAPVCGVCISGAVSQYLLTGLLRCKCGAACAGTTAREGHQYYRCLAEAVECNSTLIRVDMLDKAVLEIVRRQLRVQMTEGVLQPAAARVEGARKGVEGRAVGLRSTLATIEKQREKVRKDYLSGEIGGRAYTEMGVRLGPAGGRRSGSSS